VPSSDDRWLGSLTSALQAHERERTSNKLLLGRYLVLGEIGRGGMGIVQRAWDSQLDRVVALKVLPEHALLDVEARERMQREAQMLAGVNHPNIVAVYELGFEGGKVYLAMELVEGATLDRLRPPLRTIVTALRDAALAIDAMHRHGIIHRDIKPANLMLDVRGRVRVTDFGLAKRLGTAPKVSLSGSVVGTPAYMSPEQARSLPLDGRSDVYSLGATLYDLLCDRPPFVAKDPLAVLGQLVAKDPTPPRSLKPRLPRDLETVILKALEKEPARRYATAAEFGEDLRRWLDGDPIRARPQTVTYRLRRSLLKHRMSAGIVALLVLTIAGLLAWDIVAARKSYQRGLGEADLARKIAHFEKAARWVSAARAELPKLAQELALADDRLRKDRAHMERYGVGLESWRNATTYSTGKLQIERTRGMARQACNAFEEANAITEKATAWFMISRCCAVAEEWPRAIEAVERGLALDPACAPGQLLLAQLLLYRYSQLTAPDQGFIVDDVRHIWKRQAHAPSAAARECLLRVKQLMDRYPATLADDPMVVGILALINQDYPRAAAALRAWSQLAPWELPPIVIEAKCWLEAGDMTRLVACIERWLEFGPHATAYMWLGTARLRLGDRAGCMAAFEKAIEADPAQPLSYLYRGMAHLAADEFAAAILDFTKVIELDPACASAFINRGHARHYSGQDAAAADDFERAVQLAPRDPQGYVGRALAREKVADAATVLADLSRAIECDPTDPDLYYHRGNYQYERGKISEALKDFNRAVELNPRDADSILRIGQCRLKAILVG